ncbi:MAG: NAD(+) kinase [Gammaproteobacteria bacterium]
MTEFKAIGLITKPDDTRLEDTVRLLLEYLHRRELEVAIDQSAAILLQDTGLETVSRKEIASRCDLAIVVGGDGTLLNAARSLVEAGVAVLGINRGRVGFLADISPAAMIQQLDEILGGKYREDCRFLLQAQVRLGEEVITEKPAVNDVVIHSQGMARVIEIETHIDGRYLNTLRSDGLIISTPTGSTAYALSGGGPILHPSLDAIVLVPVCPHTLSYRPIVIDAGSEIEIRLHAHNSAPAQISFDGQAGVELTPDDQILIARKAQRLRLIQPTGHDYFEILRAKLRWSEQP